MKSVLKTLAVAVLLAGSHSALSHESRVSDRGRDERRPAGARYVRRPASAARMGRYERSRFVPDGSGRERRTSAARHAMRTGMRATARCWRAAARRSRPRPKRAWGNLHSTRMRTAMRVRTQRRPRPSWTPPSWPSAWAVAAKSSNASGERAPRAPVFFARPRADAGAGMLRDPTSRERQAIVAVPQRPFPHRFLTFVTLNAGTGRWNPFSGSSPIYSASTRSSTAPRTRWETSVCPPAACAQSRAARLQTDADRAVVEPPFEADRAERCITLCDADADVERSSRASSSPARGARTRPACRAPCAPPARAGFATGTGSLKKIMIESPAKRSSVPWYATMSRPIAAWYSRSTPMTSSGSEVSLNSV